MPVLPNLQGRGRLLLQPEVEAEVLHAWLAAHLRMPAELTHVVDRGRTHTVLQVETSNDSLL